MRTIAIINQKGGCGKTTCSINLAATLAARGQRTLLVDMDPQSHCALGLAVPEGQIEHSISEVMRAGLDGSLGISDVTWQISRRLDLAPSTMALAGLEAQLSGAHDRDRRLQQVLSNVQDQYDFCVIDCPPSIGLLTFNALRAADEVLIPVETGYFAMQGSVKQQQTIEMLARRVGHHVRFKVLATMYDVRTKLAREILNELKRQFDDRLLPVVINFNSKLKEAASFGQPITEYDAASRGMADFEQLANWLMANPPAPVIPVAAEQDQGQDAPPPQPIADGGSVGLSRAAELVERARALSARTAQLAAGLRQPAASAQPEAPQSNVRQKLARIYGPQPTSRGMLFVQPQETGRKLAVAGDFNDWQPEHTPLRLDGSLGVWQASVDLAPGRYRYQLVIDGQWMQDPYNRDAEPDDAGRVHSVIDVPGV